VPVAPPSKKRMLWDKKHHVTNAQKNISAFEAMANDEKLINYFSKFSVQWSHHIMFSKGLNESANELREAVSQELENLK
jgi:hypothetical protein